MFWNWLLENSIFLVLAIGNLIYNGFNHHISRSIDTKMTKELISHQSKGDVKKYISQQKYDLEIVLYEKLATHLQKSYSNIGLIVAKFEKDKPITYFYFSYSATPIEFLEHFNDNCIVEVNKLVDYHGSIRFKLSADIDNAIDLFLELMTNLIDGISYIVDNSVKNKSEIDSKVVDVYKKIGEQVDKCIELFRAYYVKLDIND